MIISIRAGMLMKIGLLETVKIIYGEYYRDVYFKRMNIASVERSPEMIKEAKNASQGGE